MKMRYNEVDNNFNMMMRGKAMGNGSVDESLATVNLTTNNKDRRWWRLMT